MECQICKREHPVRQFDHSGPKIRICNKCIELMGYDHQRLGERIYRQYKKNFDKKLTDEVQKTLPAVIEKLMVESDLTFELKVI